MSSIPSVEIGVQQVVPSLATDETVDTVTYGSANPSITIDRLSVNSSDAEVDGTTYGPGKVLVFDIVVSGSARTGNYRVYFYVTTSTGALKTLGRTVRVTTSEDIDGIVANINVPNQNIYADVLRHLRGYAFAPDLTATVDPALSTDNARLAAEATINTQVLNDFFNGGFRTLGVGPPMIGHYGVHVNDTIYTGRQDGMAFYGSGGHCIQRAENEFSDMAYKGGRPSRIVNITPGLQDVIITEGFNLIFSPVIFGWWNRNDVNTLAAETANYAVNGITLNGDSAWNYGNGKLECPQGLCVVACTNAINCRATGSGNSDQVVINGRLDAALCTNGLYTTNIQSVGHFVDVFEGYYVRGAMFYFAKGGKLTCNQATGEYPGGIMLRTRAIDGTGSPFKFVSAYIDGTTANNFTVWQQDAPLAGEFESNCEAVFDYLEFPWACTHTDTFKMRGYTSLTINGGQNHKSNMVKIVGGSSSSNMINIILNGLMFQAGSSPETYINNATSDLTGYARVFYNNCRDINNVPVGSATGSGRYVWHNGANTPF